MPVDHSLPSTHIVLLLFTEGQVQGKPTTFSCIHLTAYRNVQHATPVLVSRRNIIARLRIFLPETGKRGWALHNEKLPNLYSSSLTVRPVLIFPRNMCLTRVQQWKWKEAARKKKILKSPQTQIERWHREIHETFWCPLTVTEATRWMYVVGSKSFRPDIQNPRQMENAVRDT